MAQAHVDLVKTEDITVSEVTSNKIVCRLGLDHELTVKQLKGEIKIFIKDQNKTVCLKGTLFKKLLYLSESLQCIYSFIDN